MTKSVSRLHFYFLAVICYSANIVYFHRGLALDAVCLKDYYFVILFKYTAGQIQGSERAFFPISSQIEAVYVYYAFFQVFFKLYYEVFPISSEAYLRKLSAEIKLSFMRLVKVPAGVCLYAVKPCYFNFFQYIFPIFGKSYEIVKRAGTYLKLFTVEIEFFVLEG